MTKRQKRVERKVYANDFVIGKAADWGEASGCLFNFADGLFCSAASFADGHSNMTSRAIARHDAFLRAMGVDDPRGWAPRDDNTEEGDTWFRFLFPRAGRHELVESGDHQFLIPSGTLPPEVVENVKAGFKR